MTSKSLFSLSLLLFAGIVSMMGTPLDVQAALTINSVRIYVNPDMVPPANDNTPTTPINFTAGRVRALGGQLAAIDDFTAGTLQGGTLIDASNAHSAGANAFTANAGDIIAIVFGMRESGTSLRFISDINLDFDNVGNQNPGTEYGGQTYRNLFGPSRLLETATRSALTVTADTDFTLVYLYQVKSGDSDADGEWITRRPGSAGRTNDGPFIRWGGSPIVEIPDSLTVYYPRIDGSVSTIPTVTRMTINRPPAGQSGLSRYYKVRQECLDHHQKYKEAYTDACELVHDHGWALPNVPTHPVTLGNSLQTAFFKAGDTIEVQLHLSEEVIVTGVPILTLALDGGTAPMRYQSGSGSTTLTFRYTVQQGDTAFSGLAAWNAWDNIGDGNSIEDISGNKVTGHLEAAIRAFFSDQEGIGWQEAYPWGDPPGQHWQRYALGIVEYLVDTIPATVWIPGVIKNGVTHREDRRIAVVNLDATYTEIPAMTVDDFRAAVTESDIQTGAFDVEFRFFNVSSAADEVGTSFTGDDVEITGGNVARDEWNVEIAYVGLDHRGINAWPPPNHWSGNPQGSLHVPGDATNSASFLVYKATITPPLGFQGDVAISVPAGATQDIAGNASLASNTLTVPVNIPFQVVETPEIVAPAAGVYTVGEKIEVEVTYNREGLRYEGEDLPYLTLYLGEEVPANARHAVWTAQEDANSTKVTFTYTVAANDVATSLRVAEKIGLTVPSGTRLVDDTGSQLSGTGERAKGSGEGLEKLPTAAQLLPLEDTSGREVSPVVSDTPVVPYTPIFEETAPKAAATEVPRKPIVFNELGNGSGDANDWLELRNVTGSAVSLKDWEFSIVQDGKKEDTSLIVFPDVSVPANGILLIVNSAPDKTPLAAGDDIATSDVEKKGSPHLYLVNAGLSLPDDGKFLLILRKTKEKLGLNEAFVDVAGGGGSDTDAFIREQTGDYDTHVWPLQVLQAPGGDTEDALGSGKVWQRANAGVVGYHKDAWAESAFTGIGYDRKVTQSAATSGTPGYPNVAAKETATKGSVTFSEIMLDSAGGTLPQWIELYNNSKTEVLNLNRWRLEIQNVASEDLVGRPVVTLTLGDKVIQPNQTLLIVAGPARASSGSYLPADRVYDLLALHEKNLRIKSARDTFLSTEGFYLKLTDRNGELVDEVGNTDGDRRSDDAPAWAVPLSGAEGSRSSLIRRYTDGTSAAAPGQKRSSWVLAARVKKVASSRDALYWGDADDIGTPGHREGGALPVELSSFSVTRNEVGAVVLTWTTESEVDNAGFNLRRSEKRASGFTLINPALIAGAGTTGERQTYTFTDTSAKPGIEYYYQIEEVAFDGKPETLAMRMLRGPVSAANRMLTTFGEVKRQK